MLQWRMSRDPLAAPLGLAMCVAFVLVAPLSWRVLFPEGLELRHGGLRLALYGAIGAGVVLTRGTPVYDLERETVHRAEAGKNLVIPENAVVVPGARAVKSDWGHSQGIALQTPVIVKYRDEKTDAATALESWLR